MAPVTIPEGWAFFEKAPGVAAALLNAADEIGGNRKDDVRTVGGGYFVTEAVAEAYRVSLGVPAEPDDLDESVEITVTAESSNAEIDAFAAGLTPPVNLEAAKNRVEKIALLEAALRPAAADNTTEE